MLRIAKKARDSGNQEAAISFYNKALERDQDNAEALLGLAVTYIDMNLIDAAKEYVKKAEKKGCNPKKAAYLRGKICLLSGNISGAEKEFRKDDSADSLNALGAVHDSRGEHHRAQELYKQVIAKSPNYVDAYNNMGLSLMLCNKYQEAIFYMESACALPGSTAANRSNLALVYGLSGNIDKAKAVYAQDLEGEELAEKISYLEDIIAAKEI
ncbi:MAG: tetratricopeptide repeat protein [Holosporaceae bacterium]|jgi:Flp pilus assembly protein TadD|nr:tetratricopeptide repeat protein [Holosporaceae bacterium]